MAHKATDVFRSRAKYFTAIPLPSGNDLSSAVIALKSNVEQLIGVVGSKSTTAVLFMDSNEWANFFPTYLTTLFPDSRAIPPGWKKSALAAPTGYIYIEKL